MGETMPTSNSSCLFEAGCSSSRKKRSELEQGGDAVSQLYDGVSVGEPESVGLGVSREQVSSSRLDRSACADTGTNISTSEEVAIKLESVKSKHPQLLYEYVPLDPSAACHLPASHLCTSVSRVRASTAPCARQQRSARFDCLRPWISGAV